MTTLGIVADLQPHRIVSCHKNRALNDDQTTIAETHAYLEDAERVIESR
jgi:hypothetical protein